MTPNYATAMALLRPSDDWEINPEDAASLVWRGTGDPPSVAEIVAARETLEAEAVITEQRLAARTALRTTWEALPAWIRGPFGDKFDAAYRMVIAGDYEAAEALIAHAEMPSAYSLEQAATFAQVQSQMAAGIAALAQI